MRLDSDIALTMYSSLQRVNCASLGTVLLEGLRTSCSDQSEASGVWTTSSDPGSLLKPGAGEGGPFNFLGIKKATRDAIP